MSSFTEILESALSKAENEFLEDMSKASEPLTEEKLKVLTLVLEKGSVVDKKLISKLFIEVLGNDGAAYLSGRLTPQCPPALLTEAADILAVLKFKGAVGPLGGLLSSSSSDIVIPAVKALSAFTDSNEAAETLEKFYLSCPDEVMLAKSIGYMTNMAEILIPRLLKSYSSQNNDKKMWLLKFFAEVPNNSLTDLFGKELDESPLERGLYSISGLGKIGTDQAVNILKKHTENPEWFFRKHLATALGDTDNKYAVEPLLGMLDDTSKQVQGAAVDSLSKVGNLAPEMLNQRIKNCSKISKENIIRAMGHLRNKAFIPTMLELLKDRNLLFCSIDAIGDAGFVEAAPELINLLKDKIWFNRLNALEALAKLDLPNTAELASELISDENDMVRNSAVRIYNLFKSR